MIRMYNPRFLVFNKSLRKYASKLLGRKVKAFLKNHIVKWTAPKAHHLQIYSGYAESDVQLLKRFVKQAGLRLDPIGGYIVNFLGAKTWAGSVGNASKPWAGKVLPIPNPGDYHAEAIEYIGLLKSIFAALPRKKYAVMELGAGWGHG